jgi:hypothetical protein
MTTASRNGVCTNIGTTSTEAAAPSSVPAARYSALELVGATKGLETIYTVAIAQYGRGSSKISARYSASIDAAKVRTP